jgi:hypothetical protein
MNGHTDVPTVGVAHDVMASADALDTPPIFT